MFDEEELSRFLAADRYIKRQIAKRGIIFRRPGDPDRIQEPIMSDVSSDEEGETINKKDDHKKKKKKEVDLGYEDKSEKRKKKRNQDEVSPIQKEEEPKNVAAAAAADDSSHESDSDESYHTQKDAKKNATVAKKVETCDEEKADSSDESSEEETSSEPPKKKAKADEESSSDDMKSDSQDEAKTATVEVEETYVVGVVGFHELDDIDKIRDTLTDRFAHCGEILYMSVPEDYKTGRSKGCAFMDFGNSEAYNKAKEMHGSDILGGEIIVVKAYPMN